MVSPAIFFSQGCVIVLRSAFFEETSFSSISVPTVSSNFPNPRGRNAFPLLTWIARFCLPRLWLSPDRFVDLPTGRRETASRGGLFLRSGSEAQPWERPSSD